MSPEAPSALVVSSKWVKWVKFQFSANYPFKYITLPGVSPYGFDLTVSPELPVALVVLSLLGSGVVTTVNVLSKTVVLVVVATVVLETLVVCVVLGSSLP